MRIKSMHSILCEELNLLILERLKKHVDNCLSCEREYFMLYDLRAICTDILVKHRGAKFDRDSDVIDYIVPALLTFKGPDGQPWRYLDKFAAFGITTPVIEHMIKFGGENKLTIFNVSDKTVSSKILIQVVVKPNVRNPIPNPNTRKRPRDDPYSPW